MLGLRKLIVAVVGIIAVVVLASLEAGGDGIEAVLAIVGMQHAASSLRAFTRKPSQGSS